MLSMTSGDEEISSDEESASEKETTLDEDDDCIIVCPSCDESVRYTSSLSPSKHTLRLIRKGALPSEESCGDILLTAESAENEARDLDAEIQRLQAVTKKLEARRQKLLDYADQQRALVAPARRLPFEILHCIFLMACATNVLTFPLWKSVLPIRAIAQHDITRAEMNAFRKAVSFYLAKSGSQPINVCLRGECTVTLHGRREHELLPADFFTHLPRRCQKLTICDVAHAYVSAQYSTRVTMELLRSVEMRNAYGNTASIPFCMSFIGSAPRLTSWTQSIVNVMIMGLPLSRLTSLDIIWTDVVWGYDVLSECSALETLTVHLYITGPYRPPFRLIILPRLTALRVLVDPPRIFDDLLDVLYTPAVKDVWFGADEVCDEVYAEDHLVGWMWPHDKFSAFLDCSGCDLANFVLDYVLLSAEDIKRLKERLPDTTRVSCRSRADQDSA
ncbi:hypothetical protein BD626DRAFT_525354 [Schizophyllum amplum]|uniref:F-box domain-containing protein n=1 Tax=Schizophyllum amplum TaxID=97359 RepID=A0A550BSH8_9AGAR|nr:hypothetical protein BD626DRAFT_525354 [Auriculariopsis ampla]